MRGKMSVSRMAWLLVAYVTVPALTFAQQQPDPSSKQDPGSVLAHGDASGSDSVSSIPQSQANPAAAPQGLFVRALNSASPLVGANGPLQWGWVSVRSASFVEAFANVSSDVPGLPGQKEDFNLSELSTAIVLEHWLGASQRTHFTIQYTPSLFITNGNVYSNALNQDAGLDTSFQLNPRWDLQITDRLSYFASQRFFSGLSLDANYSLGAAAQNTFLNGPGSVLYNSASGSFSYQWSPVTTVSFGPTFGYQNASGAVNSKESVNALYEGGQLSVSHSLSPTQTVGISYSGSHASYANLSVTAGPQSNAWQQDFLVTYGQKLGPTWNFYVGLGISNNVSTVNQSGLGASAGITKSFQRMDFAVTYNRGHQFNGYITGLSSDRVDVIHTIRWTRRLSTTTSAAYFRSWDSSSTSQSGTYGTEQLGFALTRSLSFSGGIAYEKQTGDGVYVLSGHRLFGTVGLTWSPPARVQ